MHFTNCTTKKLLFTVAICLQALMGKSQTTAGQTEITKWQYGKNAAVSLTYDDGSINQFRRAMPVMDRLNLPATFFVITGGIPGSKYHGKFIGRPVKEIIAETATVPTNEANFFERCSAANYLGYAGTVEYHTRAGSMFDGGRKDRAYKLMDELYAKVRNGDFKPGYKTNDETAQEAGLTWPDLRKYATRGHEIASHSITHPAMPALDEANLMYELEKSKEEIRDKMGERYTFSAECPYGFENPRVMEYALKIYPALRNRMPEPFLKELDRASKETPGSTDKDYIQWQRGATTKTPMPMMKLWVDTVLAKNNTWLCLVFHGVDSLGYEPLTHQALDEYFTYIKQHEDKLWVATFGDVTKYMREREHAKINTIKASSKFVVTLTHPLDKKMYDLPVTLKTYVTTGWKKAKITQGKASKTVSTATDETGTYVLYQAKPNIGSIELKKS